MSSTTDIVPAEDLGDIYPVLAENGEAMAAFQANMGDDDFSVYDLDKITVPSGGGTTWEIPGIGGVEASRELRGVVVGSIGRRSFWEVGMEEGEKGSPPDCASENGEIGRGLYGVDSTGNPSGKCADCPMNKFQENDKGRVNKPCKEQKILLLMTEGSVLPTQVQLAPTSIKTWKKFMLRLSGQSIPFYRAIVGLSLKKVDASPAFSVVEPKLLGTVSHEQGEIFRSVGEPIVAAYDAAANRG